MSYHHYRQDWAGHGYSTAIPLEAMIPACSCFDCVSERQDAQTSMEKPSDCTDLCYSQKYNQMLISELLNENDKCKHEKAKMQTAIEYRNYQCLLLEKQISEQKNSSLEIDTLTHKCKMLEKKSVQDTKNMSQLRQVITEQETKHSILHSKIEQMQRLIDEFTLSRNSSKLQFQRESELWKQKEKTLKFNLKQKTEQCRNQTELYQRAQKELRREKQKTAELQRLLEIRNKEISDYKRKESHSVSNLQQQIKQLQKENQQYKEKQSLLEKHIQTQTNRTFENQKQLDTKSQQIVRIQSEIKNLTLKITEMTRKYYSDLRERSPFLEIPREHNQSSKYNKTDGIDIPPCHKKQKKKKKSMNSTSKKPAIKLKLGMIIEACLKKNVTINTNISIPQPPRIILRITEINETKNSLMDWSILHPKLPKIFKLNILDYEINTNFTLFNHLPSFGDIYIHKNVYFDIKHGSYHFFASNFMSQGILLMHFKVPLAFNDSDDTATVPTFYDYHSINSPIFMTTFPIPNIKFLKLPFSLCPPALVYMQITHMYNIQNAYFVTFVDDDVNILHFLIFAKNDIKVNERLTITPDSGIDLKSNSRYLSIVVKPTVEFLNKYESDKAFFF